MVIKKFPMKPGIIAHTCDPSTWEVKEVGSETSLNFMRPCLKNITYAFKYQTTLLRCFFGTLVSKCPELNEFPLLNQLSLASQH